ncbi:LysR family transcriptional regulator [Lichenicoccus sp.]|uniref:LysR family transcriptional regulator n=1 Tax=Lichenicoccus sp. TaxID=2781899 RepID=UPI003D0B2DEE
MLDLPQLRGFLVLAEELHFGRAAARLNMTQPPLSRQIQLLEHAVGAALFSRSSRVVRLTPAGRSLLPEARTILRLAENAALSVRAVAQGSLGDVAIGFTAAAGYGTLPKIVGLCRSSLPKIELRLKEMVTSVQIDALIAGRLDLGLLRPPVARDGLLWRVVEAEPLHAALPAQHRLAMRSQLTLQDLNHEDFVMYSPDEARYFYDLLVGIFSRARVSPRFVQHISQIHSVLALVRAGLGIALVPQGASSLRYEGIVLRPIVDLVPVDPVELCMVWREDHDNPALTQALALIEMGPESDKVL